MVVASAALLASARSPADALLLDVTLLILAAGIWYRAETHADHWFEPTAPPRTTPDLLDAGAALFVFLLFRGILTTVGGAWLPASLVDTGLVDLCAFVAVAGLTVAAAWSQFGRGALRILGLQKGSLALCHWVAAALVLAVFGAWLTLWVHGIVLDSQYAEVRRIALLAVLGAPLCEEILFRGLLYGAVRDRLGVPAARILSSLAFGVLHGPVRAPWTFAFGVLLAYLRERTDSLILPIVVHTAANAFGLWLMWRLIG
jgi:membrane protease YdiL (CAAX protease family)